MWRPVVRPESNLSRQRGAALLVFMLVFFLASTSWLLSQTTSSRMRNEADKITSTALAQAKEALIGRAAGDDNRPGSLPCPDFDDDGEATNGSCAVTIGRLPWKTLDLPDLRDGNGDRLWYVLASELRDNGSVPVNPALPLTLSLDGSTNIAAIVFSAGGPLAGQNGRPSNDVADYLDGANKTGGPYVSGPSSPTFNDKLVAISRDQLFGIANRRILGLLRSALEKYYIAHANLFPTSGADLASELAPPMLDADENALLTTNGWYPLVSYAASTDRQNATLTITTAPATSCTITPTQTVCTHP